MIFWQHPIVVVRRQIVRQNSILKCTIFAVGGYKTSNRFTQPGIVRASSGNGSGLVWQPQNGCNYRNLDIAGETRFQLLETIEIPPKPALFTHRLLLRVVPAKSSLSSPKTGLLLLNSVSLNLFYSYLADCKFRALAKL